MNSEVDRQPQYQPLEGRAGLATKALYVCAVMSVIEAVLDGWGCLRLRAGEPVDSIVLTSYDLASILFAFTYIAAYSTTVVLYCMWIYRASSNLHALCGEVPSHSPGAAVGWFFIPFANLYKPWKVVEEIWNSSLTLLDSTGSLPDKPWPNPKIILQWWGFWVVANALNGYLSRLEWSTEAASTLMRIQAGYVLADILFVTAAIFCVKVVRAITSLQSAKAQALPHIMTTTPGT